MITILSLPNREFFDSGDYFSEKILIKLSMTKFFFFFIILDVKKPNLFNG
jgi:hypothetical protein